MECRICYRTRDSMRRCTRCVNSVCLECSFRMEEYRTPHFSYRCPFCRADNVSATVWGTGAPQEHAAFLRAPVGGEAPTAPGWNQLAARLMQEELAEAQRQDMEEEEVILVPVIPMPRRRGYPRMSTLTPQQQQQRARRRAPNQMPPHVLPLHLRGAVIDLTWDSEDEFENMLAEEEEFY